MTAPRSRRRRSTARAALAVAPFLLSLPGCGIWFLERDPAELSLGAPAPSFSLGAAGGERVTLAELTEDGWNALLVFYRGGW